MKDNAKKTKKILSKIKPKNRKKKKDLDSIEERIKDVDLNDWSVLEPANVIGTN